MSSTFTTPARTLAEVHQRYLTMVTDAYLFYLASIHRRPVYRHQYGDISLDQPALHGFIDSYLEEKGWSIQRRCGWYAKIVDIEAISKRGNSDFIDWGTVPALKPRGIKWLNACFSRLGEMVQAQGGWKAAVLQFDNGEKADEI